MPRFFCNPPEDNHTVISGEDARHITQVLRRKPGEILTLCDGRGFDYRGVITGISPQAVTLEVNEKTPTQSESSLRVRLYQCLLKGDGFETIIQKAVELGVTEIRPVTSTFCVARPAKDSLDAKRQRWQKISLSAAKQCGRGIIPEILPICALADCAPYFALRDTLFFYEGGGAPVSDYVNFKSTQLNIIIGPEGGFSPEEAELVQQNGAKAVTLGKRILRAETAPLAALAVIMHLTGNLG
ncbi:MAG: 16S rRNA (uracil(1498)-N(3))-methyltransferase [Oscillospiraceae bacterium]|jgi:16S rRNA (uracil1498-N3)-methyltransferase|nr:16S rRNA (uracil(1498)-N(3))-methyltransferase [Oscillospiraceae bacterium]